MESSKRCVFGGADPDLNSIISATKEELQQWGLSLGLKESHSSSAWPLRAPTLDVFFWSSLGLVVVVCV